MAHHHHHVLKHVCSILAALDAGPPCAELTTAPVLQHWRPFRTLDGSVVLAGYVREHSVTHYSPIRTSGLLALDSDKIWACTVDRWYRLEWSASGEYASGSPVTADNLTVALLIEGLQPLNPMETQSLLTVIRDQLRKACEHAARSR